MDLSQNNGTQAMTFEQVLEQAVDQAKAETSMATCSYILEGLLRMTTILSGDNQLMTGRVYDEAMTYFLASFKAELGDQAAALAASRLIENIALFLPEGQRQAVHKALVSWP